MKKNFTLLSFISRIWIVSFIGEICSDRIFGPAVYSDHLDGRLWSYRHNWICFFTSNRFLPSDTIPSRRQAFREEFFFRHRTWLRVVPDGFNRSLQLWVLAIYYSLGRIQSRTHHKCHLARACFRSRFLIFHFLILDSFHFPLEAIIFCIGL